VNTGGGGGGATGANANTNGAGGSGVIILRYPVEYTITLGAGVTGSTTQITVSGFTKSVTTITAATAGTVSWL
jgi:hypothetical protein